MPILKASVKDLRKSHRHHTANRLIKNKLKDGIKEIKKLAQAGKHDDFLKKLPEITSLIDKAAKRNLIHKNNAARKKSSLARLAKSK